MLEESKRVTIRAFDNPVEAVAVASKIVAVGSFTVTRIAHDDGCPALEGGGLPACTCEELELAVERVL